MVWHMRGLETENTLVEAQVKPWLVLWPSGSRPFLIHQTTKELSVFWGLIGTLICFTLYSTKNGLQIWLLLVHLNRFIYNLKYLNLVLKAMKCCNRLYWTQKLFMSRYEIHRLSDISIFKVQGQSKWSRNFVSFSAPLGYKSRDVQNKLVCWWKQIKNESLVVK